MINFPRIELQMKNNDAIFDCVFYFKKYEKGYSVFATNGDYQCGYLVEEKIVYKKSPWWKFWRSVYEAVDNSVLHFIEHVLYPMSYSLGVYKEEADKILKEELEKIEKLENIFPPIKEFMDNEIRKKIPPRVL